MVRSRDAQLCVSAINFARRYGSPETYFNAVVGAHGRSSRTLLAGRAPVSMSVRSISVPPFNCCRKEHSSNYPSVVSPGKDIQDEQHPPRMAPKVWQTKDVPSGASLTIHEPGPLMRYP